MKQNRLTKILAFALAALLLLGLFANFLALAASAAEGQQSSSEIKKQLEEMNGQREEIEAQIAELEGQLRDNLTEMEAIVGQKNIIDQEIFLLHAQVKTTNEMISAYNVLIADKQDELRRAEERLAYLNEKNKERIRAMEEDGSLSYWEVLFKANSFSDLLDRLNMIEEIAAADRQRLADLREAAAHVAAAREELVAERINLEMIREELAVTEAELQAKRQEADLLLAQLIATGEEYEAYLEESEDAHSDLMDQIMDKQDDYASALASEAEESRRLASIEESKRQESLEESRRQDDATSPSYTKPPKDDWDPGVSEEGWRSPMTRKTWITSPYGMRFHPIHKKWKMHHGVDLEADYGDTIVAARSGVVVQAAWHKSMGYYVKIDHGDGYSSIYEHMTHYTVKAGDHVDRGQKIGEAGSTGDSTGAHLHFGIYYDGKSVNPAKFVEFS